jgi:hypothetical protein
MQNIIIGIRMPLEVHTAINIDQSTFNVGCAVYHQNKEQKVKLLRN